MKHIVDEEDTEQDVPSLRIGAWIETLAASIVTSFIGPSLRIGAWIETPSTGEMGEAGLPLLRIGAKYCAKVDQGIG